MRVKLSPAVLVAALVLAVLAPGASAATFSNTAPFDVADASGTDAPYTPGKGMPFPSDIAISGLPGHLNYVSVTLKGVTHHRPDDLDVMLVGPGGQRVVLLSDAGENTPISNADLTFDDFAAGFAPDASAMAPGSYKPTNNFGGLGEPPDGNDAFASPAPGPPRSPTLSQAFEGTNPNGSWHLYVVDDRPDETGTVNLGWSLDLQASNWPPPRSEVRADFEVQPHQACTQQLVTFNGSASTTSAPGAHIVHYEWRDSDGYFADTGANPIYRRAYSMVFAESITGHWWRPDVEMTLTAIDDRGNRGTSRNDMLSLWNRQRLEFVDRVPGAKPTGGFLNPYSRCASVQRVPKVKPTHRVGLLGKRSLSVSLSCASSELCTGRVSFSASFSREVLHPPSPCAGARFCARSVRRRLQPVRIGSAGFVIRAHHRAKVKVRLGPRARKLLRKRGVRRALLRHHRPVRIKTTIVSRNAAGEKHTSRSTLRVKRAPH